MPKKRSKTNMRKEADRRFSQIIRSRGFCEAALALPHITCAGPHQTAHLISRRYLSVRWDLTNAVCMCAAHHVWLTHHPLEHEDFCKAHLGPAWGALRTQALQRWDGDVEGVLERLKALSG